MWLSLPNHWIVILNVLGIPAVHFGVSWWFTRLPRSWFDPDGVPFRPLPGESSRVYRRGFGIGVWKEWLPDAGPWFGGFAKKRLAGADSAFLEAFRVETCRSEAAHVAQVLGLLGFLVWNPWPASLVIVIYALASNLPCILLQRHNRLRISRILAKRSGTGQNQRRQ